jgi:lysophospholipase L1-like esterase
MGKGADVLIIALGGNDGLRGISPQGNQDPTQSLRKS